MRIDGTRVGSVAEHAQQERAQAATTTAQSSTNGGATKGMSDAVVVSPAATAISAANGRSLAAQAERLEVVRAQLKEGSYKVDHDALARKLVDEELARRG